MIGVTGYKGRLGKVLTSAGFEPCGVDNAHEFDTIIHTAAYTDVDGAEMDIGKCIMSNVIFTDDLRSCTDAKIIYISTDFVFDGINGPYTEDDRKNPVSVYGLSKDLGERCLFDTDLIVRTTVLYDSHKEDFVTWVLRELKEKGTVEVSHRMITSPTNVYHLAEALLWLVTNPIEHSVINIACENPLSRWEFAVSIAVEAGISPHKVIQSYKTEFGDAPRPVHAGLITDKAKLLGIPIYSVVDGLRLMSEENKLWTSILS